MMWNGLSSRLASVLFLLVATVAIPDGGIPAQDKGALQPSATLGVAPDTLLGRALLALDPEIYGQELAWWASDRRGGREAGTRAAREVAQRAVTLFGRYGCVPMGEEVDGTRTWFQAVPIYGNREIDPDGALLQLAGTRLALGSDWTLLAGGRSADIEAGTIVDVGYCLQDEDMVRAGGEGALVMVTEGEPGRPIAWNEGDNSAWIGRLQAKLDRAARFGALAVLLVPAPGVDRPLFLRRQDLLRGRVSRRSGSGGKRRVSVPMVQLSTAQAGALKGRLAAKGRLQGGSSRISFQRTRKLQGRNIIACLPGADPDLAREYLVIGAHRDHLGLGRYGSRKRGIVHNGADDNASGSVGVLELARVCAKTDLRPKRSLLFILFDAEEKGIVGSRRWCSRPTVPLDRVAAMINLDMIGRVRVNQAVGRGTCSIVGLNSAAIWDKALREATCRSPLHWVTAGADFGGSDHVPFLGSEIPAIFFHSGLHRDYHRISDDARLCNPQGAVEVLKVALHTAMTVASLPEKPEFKMSRPRSRRRSGKVQIGILPQQTNAGVLVRSVDADSPAARAGMRKGDILVAIDGRPVARISEIYRRMRQKKVGQQIKLAWRREGKVSEKTVNL